MKYLVVALVLMINSHLTFSQKGSSLISKTFEYVDRSANNVEQYSFLSETKVRLVMKSVVNGDFFEDVCVCQYTIDGNKINVNCICEDKEIYPNPLKETFIYNRGKNTLSTTIHYDKNKQPRVFKLK